MRSIVDPPPRSAFAEFEPAFGPRFLLTVDTEEEFDCSKPFARDGHGLDHLARLAVCETFCEHAVLSPLYLHDWPNAQSPEASTIHRSPLPNKLADTGIQLN